MEDERTIESGPRGSWRVCTLTAQVEGKQTVLLPSIPSMAIFKQLQGVTSTTKIVPAERTRYVVEVREAGKVVKRIEAAVLYVHCSAKKLILERTGGPEELLPPEKIASPSAATDPEMPVRDTVSDKPLIAAATRRPTDWDELPPKVRHMLMDEAQIRGAIYVRFANGEPWAERFFIFLFGGTLEEGKTIAEQRSILRRHFDLSAKFLIERIVKAPAGDAEGEAHRAVLLGLLEELAASGGPAATWAEQLHQRAISVKREAVSEAGKQIGVASGKYPSAKRAVELLRGKAGHIKEGLTVLDELTTMHHYRSVAAASKEERRALDEAVKILTTATHAKHPAFQEGLNADLKKIRVLAADHGLQKTINTAKSLHKIHAEAEERAKDKK